MPFTRPKLADLVTNAVADIQSRLPGADAMLPRSNLAVLAAVMAGGQHGQYGYLDILARQIIPDTAETAYLERWARFWGIPRKLPSASTGNVTFTGNLDGVIVPAGTSLVRSDGNLYVTQADVVIAGGSAVAIVTAQTPGSAAGLVNASKLLLQLPIPTVQPSAVVSNSAAGSDTETDDALRARLLYRIQNPPQGGAASDYVSWATSVAGVTRVWVSANGNGPGTVVVYFVMDGRAVIFPLAGDVAAVQAYLNTVRPITAQVTVVAPNAVAQPFTIHLNPDNAANRAAVVAALNDLITREASPGGTIYRSHILQAVEGAVGNGDSQVTVPAADLVSTVGNMTSVGVITWV